MEMQSFPGEPTEAVYVKVFVGSRTDSLAILGPREVEWLRKRTADTECSAARTLVHALRIFDLYLAGKLVMASEDRKEGQCEPY
jgi:hypothetical protein